MVKQTSEVSHSPPLPGPGADGQSADLEEDQGQDKSDQSNAQQYQNVAGLLAIFNGLPGPVQIRV